MVRIPKQMGGSNWKWRPWTWVQERRRWVTCWASRRPSCTPSPGCPARCTPTTHTHNSIRSWEMLLNLPFWEARSWDGLRFESQPGKRQNQIKPLRHSEHRGSERFNGWSFQGYGSAFRIQLFFSMRIWIQLLSQCGSRSSSKQLSKKWRVCCS